MKKLRLWIEFNDLGHGTIVSRAHTEKPHWPVDLLHEIEIKSTDMGEYYLVDSLSGNDIKLEFK